MDDVIEGFFSLFFVPSVSKVLSDIINFGAICTVLTFVVKYIYNVILKRKNNLNLKPYYTNAVLTAAKNKYIRTKCQNIDPSNEIEFHNNLLLQFAKIY